MYFIDQRIQVIANQMGNLRFRDKVELNDWQYKHGQFFRPSEADASTAPWLTFDSKKNHWYAEYAGTDQFEGKFTGQNTDFHGIPGSHYWFRTTATVPQSFHGKSVWMKIRTQIEEWDDGKNPQFLIFVNGEVRQGADINHREMLLFREAKAGTEITLDIQAYTGTLHREFNFLAELYELDENLNQLYYDLQVPLWAFGRLDKDDKIRLDMQTVLNETINLLDMRVPHSKAFDESVEKAIAYIGENLYEKMGGYDDIIATCIGHTHIDVAWWWTVAQTREKVARSFATVLKLMEEYPEYKFMSSQPVLYYFLGQRYPELLEKIKERVKEGRWKLVGGWFIQPDCNIPCGESFARHALITQRYFEEKFGVMAQTGYNVDSFGHNGNLPMILQNSRMKNYVFMRPGPHEKTIPNSLFTWVYTLSVIENHFKQLFLASSFCWS